MTDEEGPEFELDTSYRHQWAIPVAIVLLALVGLLVIGLVI